MTSTTGKASREALETLHGELAKQLATRIKDGEATAADFSVARQFLKDNGIESISTPSNPLGKLASQLPFQTPHSQEEEE